MIGIQSTEGPVRPIGPVDFIFDEQRRDFKNAMLGWERFRDLAPPEMRHLIGGSPIYRDDKRVMPLQAADLLAWQTRRYHMEKARGVEYDDWIYRSLAEIPTFGWEFTEKALREILAGTFDFSQSG